MKIKKYLPLIISVIVVIAITLVNALIINPKQLKVRNETIVSNKINNDTNNLIIAYFSDLDYGNLVKEERLDEVINNLNNYNPDIIVFGGDLINGQLTSEESEYLLNSLKSLQVNYGKYAVLGELDSQIAKDILTSANFNILDNSNARVHINSNSYINLVGINCLNPLCDVAFDGLDSNAFCFVFSHYPDNFDLLGHKNFDYMCAGHSLGGQIYLPPITDLFKINGANNYYHGKIHNTNLILDITNGAGLQNKSARLFADAEIVIYKLTNN